MCRFYLLFGVAISAVLATDKEECLQLFNHAAFDCCKMQTHEKAEHKPTNKSEKLKEIDVSGYKTKNTTDTKELKCDFEIKAAKLRGLTTADDGTFDKKAMATFTNEYFSNMPELADVVVKKCVNGDLSNYGPPDLKCDLIKLENCVQIHYLLGCNEWDKSDYCTETEELVKTCLK